MAFKFDKKKNPLKKKGYISENPIKYDSSVGGITAASPVRLNGGGNDIKLSYAYGGKLTPAQEKAAQELANKRAAEIMQGKEFKPNEKGELMRSADFVHELKANRGEGLLSYKDRWNQMSDKQKARHGSLKNFEIAAEAWWDSQNKKFKGYAEEKKPTQPSEKPKAQNVTGVQNVRADVINERDVENPNQTHTPLNDKWVNVPGHPDGGYYVPSYKKTNIQAQYRDPLSIGEEIPEGADVDMVGGLESLNENITQENTGTTTDMKIRDDLNLKNLQDIENLPEDEDPLDEDFSDN